MSKARTYANGTTIWISPLSFTFARNIGPNDPFPPCMSALFSHTYLHTYLQGQDNTLGYLNPGCQWPADRHCPSKRHCKTFVIEILLSQVLNNVFYGEGARQYPHGAQYLLKGRNTLFDARHVSVLCGALPGGAISDLNTLVSPSRVRAGARHTNQHSADAPQTLDENLPVESAAARLGTRNVGSAAAAACVRKLLRPEP